MTVAICQMNSISFMHAATSVLASTVLDAPSGPKLDLLCDSRVLHPFVKIIQSFILMQNT